MGEFYTSYTIQDMKMIMLSWVKALYYLLLSFD